MRFGRRDLGVPKLTPEHRNAFASPITSAAAKVSAAAAEQQYQYDDNQDQFHGKSPLIDAIFIRCRIPIVLLVVR
jgi:hypothetical protein